MPKFTCDTTIRRQDLRPALLDTRAMAGTMPDGENDHGCAMKKRFEYRRMTAEEFRADLKAIDMPPKAFARVFGQVAARVHAWYFGQEDIPTWVPIATAVLKNSEGALGAARQEAAERIVFDHDHPERGEYPYLEREDDGDAD